jgi:hypothetical protein
MHVCLCVFFVVVAFYMQWYSYEYRNILVAYSKCLYNYLACNCYLALHATALDFVLFFWSVINNTENFPESKEKQNNTTCILLHY